MWKEGILIRADALLGLPELLDRLGGDSQAMLQEAGIKPEDLNVRGQFISWLAFQRLLYNAANQLNAPDLGLRWAEQYKPGLNNFGPIIALLVVSKDIRSFIQRWIEYARIHTMGSYTQLIEGEADGLPEGVARAVIWFNYAAFDSRQEKEALISIFYKLIRDNLGTANLKPIKVGFPHRPMFDLETYERHFSCPIEFNADYTYIDFPLEILDRRIGLGFNPGQKLFDRHVESAMRKTQGGQVNFSAQVGLMLPHILGVGKSDGANVAATLGVSLRKMQRLLKDEDSSYSDILDEVRQSMSTQLLQNSDMSVTRIAKLLDYKSPVAFSNAFKRWRGMSPRDYRNRLKNTDFSVD